MKNGSFMVFRRLKQLVPEFDQYRLTQAAVLGMDPVLLGSRLVGRWKSGAPLALTPSQDDSTVGADPQRNNNFDFSDDQGERRCPFGAHIRKTNPRADFGLPNNAGVDPQTTDVDPHRVMRAGIPFGPEVSVAEAANAKTATDRGLMFVCYQTSIPNQFEFVQIKWANNSHFISPAIPALKKSHPDGSLITVGFNPIIGQHGGVNPNPGDPARWRDKQNDHHGASLLDSRSKPLAPGVWQSHGSTNRKRFLEIYPPALQESVRYGSDDGLPGESHREATTNSESKYVACQRRAQSHAASVPPSIGATCRSSGSQKAQTVFLVSYNTTFKEQIYNRWCCIDPLRPPRLPEK
jgi:hypothetical protein